MKTFVKKRQAGVLQLPLKKRGWIGNVFKSNAAIVLYLVLISCIVEIFVFNFRYFEPILYHAQKRTVESTAFHNIQNFANTDHGWTASGKDASFSIKPDIATPVYCLTLHVNSDRPFVVSVSYSDSDHLISEIQTDQNAVDPKVPSSTTIHMRTSGVSKKLTVHFSNISSPVTVQSVELNVPFLAFHFARMLVVFVLLLFFWLVKKLDLWKRTFMQTDRRVLYGAVGIVLAAWTGYVLFLCHYEPGFWVFSNQIQSNDAYRLLTQAFSRGRFHYLVQPSSQLAHLVNPYSSDLRASVHVDCLWDNAYYRGNYYCYFGVAPEILILLPFYMVTKLYFPTSLCVFVFLVAAGAGAAHLYVTITRRFFQKIGILSFFCGLLAILFGSSFFLWLAARPEFYELSVASALCFLLWGISMVFDVYADKKHPYMRIFLAGLFFGLCVASRINLAPYMLVTVPLMYSVCKKVPNIKARLKFIAAGFAPLIAIGLLLMAYNAARFGSPVEFGQQYQLTTNDTRYDSITNVALFFVAGFHYLFQLLQVDLVFPFLHIVTQPIPSTAGWYYNEMIAGWINFPVFWILPAFFAVTRRVRSKVQKSVLVITLICVLAVLYADAVKGGVVERYQLDLQPVLTFLCIAIWFAAIQYFQKKDLHIPFEKAFCIVCVVTVVISVFSTFLGLNSNILVSNPTLFLRISRLFVFWK